MAYLVFELVRIGLMMVQALLMLVSVHLVCFGFVLLIQVGIHFHLTFRLVQIANECC